MHSEQVVLGSGCFWCSEAVYQRVIGVTRVEPGYAGGYIPNPGYEQVTTGETGHAEVIRLTFKPDQVSLSDILDIFWVTHDPTTPNRQGNDVGSQYRSIILYQEESQQEVIKNSIKAAQKLWPRPITTEVKKLEAFYPAEDYHRNYYLNHPEQAYCQIVINPKLAKLHEKFNQLLRD